MANSELRRMVSTPVKVLAMIHIIIAIAGLVAGVCVCTSFWLIPGRFSNTVLAFAIPIFLFFTIFVFLPQLAGGIALLLGRAWARILMLLISGIIIFIVPIGSVLGGYGMWALLSDHAGGEARSGGDVRNREVPAKITGAYLLATLLLLVAGGAAGIIVMETVFRFQEQDTPSLIEDMFPGALIALPTTLILAAATIGIAYWRGSPPERAPHQIWDEV